MSPFSSLLSELTAKYGAGDVVGGQETLMQIKIALLEAPSQSPETVQVACHALELGVLLTVQEGDLDAFSRNMAQLQPYYDQAKAMGAPPTPRKCHILGLNLMYLLVENSLSEFHAQLELLDAATEASDPLVSFPIELERQLMVGLYDQVLTSKVPDASFQFFVDNLLGTVRDSIADCMEVSYKSMSMDSAKTMMKYSTTQELLEYIQECREDWIVDGPNLLFQPPSQGTVRSDIPSMEWIASSLSYAAEVERIV